MINNYAIAQRTEDKELYQRIVEWGMAAEVMSIDEQTRESILAVVIRSHVRLGNNNEARALIAEFGKRGYLTRDSLEGFYLRFNQEYEKAIPFFRRAYNLRIHNEAILHELCICLVRTGEISGAAKLLDELAAKRSGIRNPYLLDMRIQILIAEGKYPEAEREIEKLRGNEADEDRSGRRLALLLMSRDQDYGAAIQILSEIIDRRAGASSDFRAVRAIALAWSGKEAAAREDLMVIQSRSMAGPRVSIRLEATFALARKDWKEALKQLSAMGTKTPPDYRLEAKALELKAVDPAVSIAERQAAANAAALYQRRYKLSSELDIV